MSVISLLLFIIFTVRNICAFSIKYERLETQHIGGSNYALANKGLKDERKHLKKVAIRHS